MKKLATFAIAAVFIVILGGAVFLATWDIPPPNNVVEKDIPNDRLPK
jgi:hypothetical protein